MRAIKDFNEVSNTSNASFRSANNTPSMHLEIPMSNGGKIVFDGNNLFLLATPTQEAVSAEPSTDNISKSSVFGVQAKRRTITTTTSVPQGWSTPASQPQTNRPFELSLKPVSTQDSAMALETELENEAIENTIEAQALQNLAQLPSDPSGVLSQIAMKLFQIVTTPA